jgi:hypothetical protein
MTKQRKECQTLELLDLEYRFHIFNTLKEQKHIASIIKLYHIKK